MSLSLQENLPYRHAQIFQVCVGGSSCWARTQRMGLRVRSKAMKCFRYCALGAGGSSDVTETSENTAIAEASG